MPAQTNQRQELSKLTINPYQPTPEVSETLIVETPDLSTVLWGSWGVYWRTVLAVAFAGAAFGGVCGFIPVVMRLGSDGMGGTIVQTMFLIPLAAVIGGIFALVVAVPTVGLLVFAFKFFSGDGDWNRSSISWFAFFSGLLSGSLSIAVPSGFDPGSVAFSLFPGGFGAVAALVAMLYLARNMPEVTSESERTFDVKPLSTPVDPI